MKRGVIYYPFMSVPSYDWMKQALLFNDKIGFISPDMNESAHFDDRLSSFLYGSGMLEEIVPPDLLGEEFANKFVNALDKDLSDGKFQINYGQSFHIWGGKFLRIIEDYFSKNKITKEIDDKNLFLIDEKIGSSYIAAVAHEVLNLEQYKDYVLYSNSVDDYLNTTNSLNREIATFQLLNSFIPIPKTNDFEKIAEFRERNQKHKEKFVKMVDYKLNSISVNNIVDNEQLKLIKEEIDESLEDYRDNILTEFGKRNAVKKIGLSMIPVVASAVIPEPFTMANGIITGVTSLCSVGTLIDDARKRNKEKRDNAFYYLAKIEKGI
ncbi:hypothetical protein [Halobacteriovorax marinus]|uniref:hypothetical protein n=1 Tax=Halobacteriovorax marinus TaxID=97084 RepID=UPI003A90E904